ncbi:30S ribosomal protein S9 [Candidatus Woesearchaeota archaeon]|nr:30S ribosomal protein S9 [Candidatus Woesearchaeota archaeon]
MKSLHASGKRKKAIARATLSTGTGVVRVNKIHLDNYMPEMARNKIREPMILLKKYADKVDIDITVHGGGWMSQADAIRVAVSRCFVEYKADSKTTLQDYDRNLLVADVRTKESRKPNCRGKARSKRQKSYR